VSPPHLDVNLEAIRICLRNLERTIASLFQFPLLLPEGPLRDRLIDEVSALDSIQAMMRTVPFAMAREPQQFQQGHQISTRYG